MPLGMLVCDSADANCVSWSLADFAASLPTPNSSALALVPFSKTTFAALIISCIFCYLTGAISLIMARRVNVLLGVAAWQPYNYGTANLAVAAWLVQRPMTVMRLAVVAEVFAMLGWCLYTGAFAAFVVAAAIPRMRAGTARRLLMFGAAHPLSNAHLAPLSSRRLRPPVCAHAPRLRHVFALLAGPVLSFSARHFTAYSSVPGIGFILACVAAVLVISLLIMVARAARRLIAAEIILGNPQLMAAGAAIMSFPAAAAAGGFVTVGAVPNGMGLGAPGGAVAVPVAADGFYPPMAGGGAAYGAQAVPLAAGSYAPPAPAADYSKGAY
jgi:hypothetical protein